jgi:exo-beta-1,3-glucanase (GH17 family)
MKGGLAAAALAALAGSANAALPHHRMAHNLFKKGDAASVCVPSCTTIWTTITGEPTLVPGQWKTTSAPPPPPPKPTTTADKTTTVEVVVVPIPTPEEHKCPTTGVYTFPATTVTVTESTTVCVGQTTKLPAGTHTIGGVTTVVAQPTTVTCPYAKETEKNGVKTSVIETTVYVCPTAGTYTIAPITTVCAEETKVVYPVPTSYAPGTYTAPEQVVTVTETDYVYVCPYTQSGLPTTQAPQPTYVAPAPQPTKVEEPKVEQPKETPKEEPKKEVKTENTYKKVSSGGNLQGSNDHYGITYTPYTSDQAGKCKDAATVKKDLQDLKSKGFQIIRSYSTDCDTLTSVGDACAELGLDLIIGVFVKNTGCSYETPEIKKQVDAIAEWNNFGHVKLFVVGNEAIMNNYCSPDQLATLITTVKSKVSGYTGPYTIAETLNIWEREDVKSAICGHIDVTGANIHPYFNTEVSPEGAGKFVQGQIELLKKICPSSKDVINLECGWPSQGTCNGLACPGKEAQATAIQSIREACGEKTVFFSYENDEWKDPGSCGCERSWGCKDVFA